MNGFDAAIYAVGIVAVIAGFQSGLMRSVATILGYALAMPIAPAAASFISPALADRLGASADRGSFVLFACFLGIGVAFGQLLRLAVNEMAGPTVGIVDRLAGSALGAVRVFLVAVTMVLVFDQFIPPDRQPAFLSGSRLRPTLSMTGQKGLRSLPPEVTAYIDQLKRDLRI